MKNRGKIYLRKFNLINHDLDKETSFNLDKRTLLKKLIRTSNNYDKYLKRIYFIDKKYKDVNKELSIEIEKYKKNIIN